MGVAGSRAGLKSLPQRSLELEGRGKEQGVERHGLLGGDSNGDPSKAETPGEGWV